MASIFSKPEKLKEFEVSSYFFNNETLEFDIPNDKMTYMFYHSAITLFINDCEKFKKEGYSIIHEETDSSGFGKIAILERNVNNVTYTIKIMLIVS